MSDGRYKCQCERVQELTPDQVVALVSCTIWQERAEAGQKVREDMQGPYGALTEAARRVAKVSACLFMLCMPCVLCPARQNTAKPGNVCIAPEAAHSGHCKRQISQLSALGYQIRVIVCVHACCLCACFVTMMSAEDPIGLAMISWPNMCGA